MFELKIDLNLLILKLYFRILKVHRSVNIWTFMKIKFG